MSFKFSNFQPFEIEYQGVKFPTVEHFYQAMKSEDLEDWKRIASCEKPGQAKRLGRNLPMREDWGKIKFYVMEEALKLKFAPGTIYYQSLMDTGNEQIVERNYWHDNIWGDCYCSRCDEIEGKNYLGKILMKIRDSYK